MAASASGQARVGACEDNVQMCVEGVCKHTGLGKKKTKKKTKNKKQKRKEKKKTRTCWKPIHRLHGTGSSMPVVSLWVEGRGRLRANHRPCAEAVGGHAGDACNVYSSGCHQDLTMAPQLDLLARQGWGHARLVFGCVSRGCANAQDREKKTKSGLTSLNPHKNADLYRPCVSCVCVASVRACREACEGGMAMAAKRGQWERLW